MSILDGARSHYRLFGPRGVALIARARLSRTPLEVTVNVDGIARPIHLRLRTTDVSVYEEIVLCGEYHIDLPVPPRVIVDAGANIGMTSVYFANRYPEATIIAIEPERSNFEMLQKNAAGYPNIRPVRAALWKENAELVLSDPGTGTWGFQTRARRAQETAATVVPAMTIDALMLEHGFSHIDVLKMDIEGSEVEVFETCAPWIDRVGTILVELHDRTRAGCSDSAHAATRNFTQEWSRGETTCFSRTPIRSRLPQAGRPPIPTGAVRRAQIAAAVR